MDGAPEGSGGRRDPGTPLGAPERLGPYRIEGKLGRGAMGVVYRAVHVGLKRECALKVLRGGPAGASGATLERFEREAAAGARLGKHPHVVEVFDVGEAGGRVYIAMELVEGRDLGRVVEEEGPLTEEKAFEIIRKVAIALDHAHRRGIIHRDLKPSNVILDADGEPKLTDFGLALDTEAARLTAEGDFAGTPAYMAPEQTEGRRGRIGPPTDVYALGATLFDILSGRPPFEGSVVGILASVVLDEPPRLRTVRPEVSPIAEAIVMKAMEKRPEDRYRTALELADDLGCALARERTSARPPGLRARARRLARRHRAVVAVLALALAAGLAVAAVASVRGVRARARREAATARALEALDAVSPEARVAMLQEAAALDPDWPAVYTELAERSFDDAMECYRVGDFARYDAGLRLALEAIDGALRRGAGASSLYLAGAITEWLGDGRRAAASYRRAAEADPRGYFGSAARACAAVIEGEFPAAVEAATRAIEIDASDYGPFLRRSIARLALGDLDGALADAEAALEREPSDDWSLAQRARVRLARGEVRRAGAELAAAIEFLPHSPLLYGALAAAARREGEAARAEALERRARSLAGGRPPPYLACGGEPWAALAPRPGPAAARRERASRLLAAADAEGAIAEASVALGLSPADGEAFRIRAQAFRTLGREADAAHDLEWAALLAPAAPEPAGPEPGR